jgi:DNA methylase
MSASLIGRSGLSSESRCRRAPRYERGPRDIVLDTFCGSGTTILAAERVGRRARALEIDPRYVDVSIRRWQAYIGQQPPPKLSVSAPLSIPLLGGVTFIGRPGWQPLSFKRRIKESNHDPREPLIGGLV